MNHLVRYDAACRAIAECKTVDEAKDIRDKAIAMAAYARQAKNRDLEADCVEIRMRATRRLDELRQAQAETVGLNRGLSGSVVTGLDKNPVKDERPTLASQGIDKNLAHQARQLGRLTNDEFEHAVTEARDAVSSVVRRAMRGAARDQSSDAYDAKISTGCETSDRWAYGHGGSKRNIEDFKEKRTRSTQANDTWGICVPIERIERDVGLKRFNVQQLTLLAEEGALA